MKHDSRWLLDYQKSNIARFFPSYGRQPWVPTNDQSVETFYAACVKESGGIILWDILNAIETVKGVNLKEHPDLVTRSKYNPNMIRKQCKSLEEGGRMGKFDPMALTQAFMKVRKMFRVEKLTPLDLGEVPYQPSTSAGLPTLMKKSDDYPRAMKEARRIQKGKRPEAVVQFHRGKNDTEARFVAGYPFAMSLIEGRFFYPYQNVIVLHHTPYAGGRYDFELAGLLNEPRCKSRFILEMDYSKFDSSISKKLIEMAFAIIRENFIMDKQDEKDFDIICHYFIHTPMLAPDGYIYTGKDHGVPSGSCFTQMIDSIVNCLILEYANHMMEFRVSRYYVLGDDVIMGIDRPIKMSELADVVSQLGITLNVKKSRIQLSSEEVHFLGHDWSNFIAVRDEMESLMRVCTPERCRNEYFSTDKAVRTTAYIERLKSYQDDNPRSFCLLQEIIEFYRSPSEAKKKWWFYRNFWIGHNYYDHFYLSMFNPEQERTEVRWKHNKADPGVGKHRGKAAFI